MPRFFNPDLILPLVRTPGRYLGRELHTTSKDWQAVRLRYCLVFPDLYEIGMSHQGLQILYHIINRRPELLAHRCYAPDVDMEAELRQRRLPLFALESRRSLADYDVIGITLPYELCYTNILTILDLGNIPLRSRDRDDRHPLVLGGGSCSLNPEPVADFFDAIVLGDGEEVILEISAVLQEHATLKRSDLLSRLARIAGVYVPSLFLPQYHRDRFIGMTSVDKTYTSVRRRILADLDGVDHLQQPLVPLVRTIHDRLGVEIARGCTRGCRFCQAGIIYRPVRERQAEAVLELARQGVAATGFDELALLSLSTGDYSCLSPLVLALMDSFSASQVSVSMPSMRVGTLTPEIMEQIRRVRKTGFTIAPEAGSERLRQVINKGITEADLLATCKAARELGWNLIKFYFMVGLPTETEADLEAIVALVQRARQAAGVPGRRLAINVSVATFVPKPHTPFQWEGQLGLETSREKINLLKKLLPRKGFKLKWHDPRQSFLEGVFSRGDRRLSRLIEMVWQAGGRLDGWSEHFALQRWLEAAGELALDLDGYLREREPGAPLPWDHLHSGVENEFLLAERERAWTREYTPDCRVHGCQRCGLCDFKTIYPRRSRPLDHQAPIQVGGSGARQPGRVVPGASGRGRTSVASPIFRYRVFYSRLDDSRFLGHLEMLQLIYRLLRRTAMPVCYSQGFHPVPRVAFGPALPLGVESSAEYFDMELTRPLGPLDQVIARFNDQLPRGMRVQQIIPRPREKGTPPLDSRYRIILPPSCRSSLQERLDTFLSASSWMVERQRKGKKRSLDIRPLVVGLTLDNRVLELTLRTFPGRPGMGVRLFLEQVCGFSEQQVLLARIVKEEVREVAVSSSAKPCPP